MAKRQIRDYVFTPGVSGVGNIKILDKIQLNQILLITNTTSNDILYNFSDPTNKVSVSFTDSYDAAFPYASSASNGVTTIIFLFDTRSYSSTDSISIFVESLEQRMRPYDFGTDAIERMRVATPQSMIDADFEYGLQPTKWQTIDLLRNYPSIYEIAGSDISLSSVVTDASFSTGGIGYSLISVTSIETHGLSVGSPFRITALNPATTGAPRAEGSFIVESIISSNTFTYFAKGKVGLNQGDSLLSTYTQFRKAGFYTSASIGNPTYSVLSNISSGTFNTKFTTATASPRIAYSGVIPVGVGFAVTISNVPTGTQITGISSTSATTTFADDVAPPTNTIKVTSTNNIQVGSAVNDGTNTATFVTNIDGNILTLSRPYTVSAVGGASTLGIVTTTGSNFGLGSGAIFNVNRTNGRYTPSIVNAGVGYTVNDRVIVPGSSLDGASPTNNLAIKIQGVSQVGGITTFTTAKYFAPYGEAAISQNQYKFNTSSLLLNTTSGGADYIRSNSNPDFLIGTNDFTVEFWIYRNRLGVTETIFDMRNFLTEYSPVLKITSNNTLAYYLNGVTVINSSNTVLTGSWNHIALSRTSNVTRLYINGTQESSNLADSSNYPERGITIGASYTGTEGSYCYIDDFRLTIGYSRYTGSSFSIPTSPFVTDVYTRALLHFNGRGGDTDFADETYGTAISNTQTFYNTTGVTTGSGYGAVFDVIRVGGATTVYTVNFTGENNSTGLNYSVSDTILIDGSLVGGNSVTNDLTITVDNIDIDGAIVGFTPIGISSSGNLTYSNRSVVSSGSSATVNISKATGSYVVSIANSGSGYYPGYILKVPGTSLGGTSPTNDLNVTVVSVNLDSPVVGTISSISYSGTATPGTAVTFFPSISLSEISTGVISDNTTAQYSSLARIQVQFDTNHGLVPGSPVLSSIVSAGVGHSLASGPFIIDSVPALNQIVFTAKRPGTIVSSGLAGTVYPRPDCYYVHRPFDGGVQLGTGGPAHGAQAVRQSKKYIRYQSGKGIMYTTGALFAPSYDLRSVTSSGISTGSVITCITDDTEHGLQAGAEIQLSGLETSGYTGTYTVNSIVNEYTFTVLSRGTLGSTTPVLGRPPQISLYKWKGATVRAGAFDDQNGIFWQYDGVNLAVGMRSATFQLAGTISADPDSNSITGVNTRFVDQLVIGDRIVIRGMTHVVTSITNSTAITVNPDYRGVGSITGAKASLVRDTIIPQSQWNLDRADGTGKSGYEIKINKMQMIGFQYTWYGAGFIDWMLRGPDGNYLFIHRLKNNNRNTEAYMRSGNLPVRYEVINEGAKSKITSDISSSASTMTLEDATLYPSSGTLYLDNEIVNYTTKTGNILGGLTRGAIFSNYSGGSTRTYTAGTAAGHNSGTGAILIANTATPVISHWGSAFLTDGMFDTDRGYVFNYQYVGGTITTVKSTAFLIRLAPTVSNAIIGDLGQRELINRAQLLLKSLEFTPTSGASSQAVVIEGVLNPSNYPTNPSTVNWFGLSSQGAGGQPSFAQIANASNITWAGGAASYTASTSVTQNYFTQYQIFDKTATANVRIGHFVSGTGVPGGTRVINIFQYDANNNYIQFSNSVNSGSAGSISYTFTANTLSAAPGETVFSFVGTAVDKSTIDLAELKELNNTPIGGRGTFPNGPDVLAINVYLTTGSNIGGNFVLRWSEAQA